VVTTIAGKGTLPEDHPLSMGAGLARRAVADLTEDSDVVLAVGTELSPAELWSGPLALAEKVVRIDIDPAQAVTNAVPVVAVVGDAGIALGGLLERLGEPDLPGSDDRAGEWRARFWDEARADTGRWDWILDGIGDVLGRDGIIATDNAMVAYDGAVARLSRFHPRSFLFPGGYGTLGYGLPAAIGAKVARPSARVVALMGDGGMMFTLSELASGAQLGIALPVVVVDNGGYGAIRAGMVARGDPVHGVDLDSPDFAAIARGLGCHGVRVDDPASFTATLERAATEDRPTVVHVRDGV
jgi:acetolactate synthase-1/2/3 large subunit